MPCSRLCPTSRSMRLLHWSRSIARPCPISRPLRRLNDPPCSISRSHRLLVGPASSLGHVQSLIRCAFSLAPLPFMCLLTGPVPSLGHVHSLVRCGGALVRPHRSAIFIISFAAAAHWSCPITRPCSVSRPLRLLTGPAPLIGHVRSFVAVSRWPGSAPSLGHAQCLVRCGVSLARLHGFAMLILLLAWLITDPAPSLGHVQSLVRCGVSLVRLNRSAMFNL